MFLHRIIHPASLPAVLLGALLLAACAAPLGPGYTVVKQNLEVRLASKPQPHLEIRGEYRLLNSGNRPLEALELTLPAAESFHRRDLRVEIDGRAAIVQPGPPAGAPDSPDRLRIPFDVSWPQKQPRALSIIYELSSGSAQGSTLSAADATFHASAGSWAPVLLPPGGLFSPGGKPPKKWPLAVRVPAEFRVHASGRERGTKRERGEWVYRFEQRPRDFAPFAAGGRFHERQVHAQGQNVIFWALQPLPEVPVREPGQAIAARVKYYDAEYGPRGKGNRPVWLIECELVSQNFGCGQLPEVVLVDSAWFARGALDREFLTNAQFELAYTWFGDIAGPRFDVEPLPMDAAGPYAGWEGLATRASGAARLDRIRWLLSDYDERLRSCVEKPILSIARSAGCEYPLAWHKSALFFFALEDRVGRESLHRALRRMVQALRGRSWNANDLRAALHAQTGQDLADFFRQWLNEKGIPADFRARYTTQTASGSDHTKENEP